MQAAFAPDLSELIRCGGRDWEISSGLLSRVLAIFDDLKASAVAARWLPEIECCVNCGYLLLTNGLGLQTLGEEYVGLVQYVASSNSDATIQEPERKLPPTFARLLMCILQSWGNYLLRFSIRKCRKFVQNSATFQQRNSVQENWLDMLDRLEKSAQMVSRLQLAMFYIFGDFSSLAKRLLGIRYLTLRTQGEDLSSTRLFRALGWAILAQVVGSFLAEIYDERIRPLFSRQTEGTVRTFGEIKVGESIQKSWITCPLCLENECHFAATFCGHVFCWDCITEHLRGEHLCPQCKLELSPVMLVPLFNL